MEKAVTFDGMDIDKSGEWLATPFINIWKRYNPRDEIVAQVAHGTTGTLLEVEGARCKVKVDDTVGYVTYWFIKELKDKFLERRRRDTKGAE